MKTPATTFDSWAQDLPIARQEYRLPYRDVSHSSLRNTGTHLPDYTALRRAKHPYESSPS